MTRSRRGVRTAAACAALLALASPAMASISMTVNPTTSISWNLAAEGANSRSGGSMTISATLPYRVTLTADKTRLSEYNPSTPGYVTGGKTLAAPLNVTAARTGGTATVPGIGSTAVVGTSTTVATGTGGLGGQTDAYAITLSQTTAITDQALASGRVYRIVLTYTASSAL